MTAFWPKAQLAVRSCHAMLIFLTVTLLCLKVGISLTISWPSHDHDKIEVEPKNDVILARLNVP